MIILEIILAVLLAWYLCGVLNIAIVQAVFGDDDFSLYQRNMTLVVTYGTGPIFTIAGLVCFLARFPIKFGTRIGRRVGRFIHDADA